MSEDVELPKRQPQQALDALRAQPAFVTPWPLAPGVSGWFHTQEWAAADEDGTKPANADEAL